MDEFTKQQTRVIEEIKGKIPYFDFYNSDKYEIKNWECEILDGTDIVSLHFITGMIGDEDTIALFLCRKIRHIFIGPRGGIKTYTKPFGTNRKRKKAYKNLTVFEVMNEYFSY